MSGGFLDINLAFDVLDDFISRNKPEILVFVKVSELDIASIPSHCVRDISYYFAIKSMLLNLKYRRANIHEIKDSEVVIEPVLTAHPTEPLSDKVINILLKVLDSENPLSEFQKILPELFSVPLTPLHKLTVKEEVKRNLKWYSRIKNYSQNVKIRSWAGGDVDGNSLVNTDAMKEAAKLHSSKKYPERMPIDVRQNAYTHSLTIAEILEKLESHLEAIEEKDNYETELLRLLKQFHYIEYVISKDDPLQHAVQKEQKRCILLDILLSQSKIFTIIKHLEQNLTSVAIEELERIKLMKRHPDIFKTYIISGCEYFSDVLQLVFLLKIFDLKVEIVPLFESKAAIENGDVILTKAFDNTHYQNAMVDLKQKIMIGFSDSQKESGSMVLPLIDISIEKMKRLCFNRGIKLKVFYGNGLDIGRGGPSIVRAEQTIQGNHIRYNFATRSSALSYFKEIVEYEASCAIQSDDVIAKMAFLNGVQVSTAKFETLWSKEGYFYALENYLEKASPFYLFVRPNNFSSRPSKRNVADALDHPYAAFFKGFTESSEIMQGIRAISWVNTIEGTFTNFNLWFGLLDGLLKIKETYDPKKLFESNAIFKEICIKAMIGLTLADFDIAWEYLPVRMKPSTKEEIKVLAELCNLKKGRKDVGAEMFLSMLQYEAMKLVTFFEEAGISLPHALEVKLNEKKDLMRNCNRLMVYLNRSVVFEKKHMVEVLENVDEDQFFEIAGAIYVAFTEFRTPIKC